MDGRNSVSRSLANSELMIRRTQVPMVKYYLAELSNSGFSQVIPFTDHLVTPLPPFLAN